MSRRLIITGGSRPLELILVDTLIVGRDPACDITETNDPLLSRRHAAFSAGEREAIVRDLDSRNGILVNGARTKEARLKHGDVVQIGHLQVKFVDEVGPFTDLSSGDDAATHAGEIAATQRLETPATAPDIAPTRIIETPAVAPDLAATKKLSL